MKTTEIERLSMRNKAKLELERLNSIYNDSDLQCDIGDFKDKFLICEVVYKVILEEHQYRKKGERIGINRLKLNMNQVPHALKFAGYDYDRDLLTMLFGSEERVGRRSAKKLRDNLTHEMSKSAINELLNRKEEFYGYMNSFIETIEGFDNIT